MSFSVFPEIFSAYPIILHRIWDILQELAGTCLLVSHLCHALNNACCRGHGLSFPDPVDEPWEAPLLEVASCICLKLSMCLRWFKARDLFLGASLTVLGPHRHPHSQVFQWICVFPIYWLHLALGLEHAQCSLQSCRLLRCYLPAFHFKTAR